MIDLTKITLEQANKIECALLQLEGKIKETKDCWCQLAVDQSFSDKARENFASNASWWQEVYELIYGGKQ